MTTIMAIAEEQRREVICRRFGVYSKPQDREKKPFYFVREGNAPSGWYQWTDDGLVYLGESILESA